MKTKYLTPTRRVAYRFCLPALGWVHCLQVKGRHRWRTVSWMYDKIISGNDFPYLLQYLEWEENHIKRKFKGYSE